MMEKISIEKVREFCKGFFPKGIMLSDSDLEKLTEDANSVWRKTRNKIPSHVPDKELFHYIMNSLLYKGLQ